jgi:hypothetical protein
MALLQPTLYRPALRLAHKQGLTAFQAALEAGDLDAIRRIPKSDLHNHFFLSGNRALVSAWAGTDIAPLDRRLGSMAEMHEWVQARFGALFAGAIGTRGAHTAPKPVRAHLRVLARSASIGRMRQASQGAGRTPAPH